MTVKIVVLFNLKSEISIEDYETWAKEKDLPTVNGLSSVDKFGVYKSVGLLASDDKPPYAYIEILDVTDMDKFGKDISTDNMQALAAEFQGMASDLIFILTDKLG